MQGECLKFHGKILILTEIFKFQICSSTKSEFCYAVPVKEGPIWSIKFYPVQSGEKNILGSLAVSTGTGDVFLFNLPMPDKNDLILNLTPNCEFKLMASKSQKYCVYRVNWSKGGCNNDLYLAAGYTNGMVALWDLNKIDRNEKQHYPIHILMAHTKCVSAVDFHFTENTVYLLTCGTDRRMKVYSLTDAFPCEISLHVNKTSVLGAEFWLNWTSYLTGNDECFSTSFPNTQKQPHDLWRSGGLISNDHTITDLSLNDYLNVVVMASDNGDILTYHMKQFAYYFGKPKNFSESRLVS